MRRTLESQQGVAMIMALGAIVIIGVLMGSVLFVSTQDYRVGGNTVRMERAATAAELGLNRVPLDWNLADNLGLTTGNTRTKTYTAPGGGSANVVITRLPSRSSGRSPRARRGASAVRPRGGVAMACCSGSICRR